MHLSKFTGLLTEKYWPTVPCPTCEVGNLRLDGAVKVTWASHVMTAPAYPPLAEVDHGGAFTAHLRCDDSGCQEGAVVAGRAYVDEQWERPSDSRYQTFLQVHFVEPALRLFHVPPATPDSIREAVRAASIVMWASPSSAANRLRYAVEEILDDQGVTKSGTTHGRIERFSKTDKPMADALMAVKWIGNEGSHQDVLTTNDVLDDAEILKHVVVALYGIGNAAIEAKIKAINDAKGIVNKPT
ncbi:DUF4145 domain-containing protein [Nocardioides sp. Leaf285]|uniref:DUF4145 domain-containing protein n=1 Tax=Nocardioides sp. Leaf285 TaxID=1736322 RepID=UPI000703727B|nr:DUF4145 domain-containing protein [Nocardioides sp. Leaf285]KQP63517.1 hypothetical protein ASF47_15775 [Nocardioides sp. Leaf285]